MKFEVLKTEYHDLFSKCEPREEKFGEVNQIVERIMANETRYRDAASKCGVPWSVIAIIHSLESNLNFKKHLHNGDSLDQKTHQVPAGRPPGNPPFTWEASAADALQHNGLTTWAEWTIPGALFVFERYNGAGYQKRGLRSPYLWSYSNHYTKGKFVADGKFDHEAVSQQCGAAVLLKTMLDLDIDLGLNVNGFAAHSNGTATLVEIEIGEQPLDEKPLYPNRILRIGDSDRFVVRPLQLRLNKLGCGELRGTGFFGRNTEAAVKLFQARFMDVDGRPLTIDGEVGAITWAALFGAETVKTDAVSNSDLLSQVVEIAVSQIGVTEDPSGSNRGARVEEYLRAVRLGGGFPWCVAFVYWCFEQSARRLDRQNPMVQTGGVLHHWTEAGRRNIPRLKAEQAVDNPALIVPGMIFTIDTGSPGGAGHTGLVERVAGGRLVTIEGNTNDGGSRDGTGVFRRDARKISSINKGFIDYSNF